MRWSSARATDAALADLYRGGDAGRRSVPTYEGFGLARLLEAMARRYPGCSPHAPDLPEVGENAVAWVDNRSNQGLGAAGLTTCAKTTSSCASTRRSGTSSAPGPTRGTAGAQQTLRRPQRGFRQLAVRALLVGPPVGDRTCAGGDAAVAEHAAPRLRAAACRSTSRPRSRRTHALRPRATCSGSSIPTSPNRRSMPSARAGVGLIISPIWWDRTALFRLGPLAGARRFPVAGRRASASVWSGCDMTKRSCCVKPGRGALRQLARQAALLRRCDVVADREHDRDVSRARVSWASTACRMSLHSTDSTTMRSIPAPSPARSGVVCVGRLEPLKNQAMLLFALAHLDVEITAGRRVARCAVTGRRVAGGRPGARSSSNA